MEAALLRLYAIIPPWLVALLALFAAVGFVRLYMQARRGAVVIAAPVALAVALPLAFIAVFYLIVAPQPISFEAKGGFVRLLIIMLCGALIVFNLAALLGENGRHD